MRERAIVALERVFSDRSMREQVADMVLLAALDPNDDTATDAIASHLATEATKQRNELRMIRQGIDLSNAQPVSPAIFKGEARDAIVALRDLIQKAPSDV